MNSTADFHPIPGSAPRHLGIIPDGGRRWAKSNECSLQESYIRTRSLLQEMVGFLIEKGIHEISLYLSSIQNFRRTGADWDATLDLFESSFKKEITDTASHQNLKVVVTGNREIIPSSLANVIITLEQFTQKNDAGRLNLLFAYDPLVEITSALKTSGNPDIFFNFLSVSTPVDLVIRSGGATLLSNFLPLQSAFARLYFTNTLFNDMTTADLEEILVNFAKTERKFGE